MHGNQSASFHTDHRGSFPSHLRQLVSSVEAQVSFPCKLRDECDFPANVPLGQCLNQGCSLMCNSDQLCSFVELQTLKLKSKWTFEPSD